MNGSQAHRIARQVASSFRVLLYYDRSLTQEDLVQEALLAIMKEVPKQPKLWGIVAARRLHDHARHIQVRTSSAPVRGLKPVARASVIAQRTPEDEKQIASFAQVPDTRTPDPVWWLHVRRLFNDAELEQLISTVTEASQLMNVSRPVAGRKLKQLREEFAAQAA